MGLATGKSLQTSSLRSQVYEILRQALDRGDLVPGDTIDQSALCQRLGISRTPLREALLRLETEGFVTIRPRSGIEVRRLTERDIRNLYQMIGALEASVLLSEADSLTPRRVARMRAHHEAMREALADDDFDRYNRANLALHDGYLGLSANRELVAGVGIMKRRLYEFPRRRRLLREWEEASAHEHEAIIAALEAGDPARAASLVRDVHWSFSVQESFIRRYYREELER